jgi:hypothetical protein
MIHVLLESPVMQKRLGLFLLIFSVQLCGAPLFAEDTERGDVLDLLQGYEWQLEPARFASLPADVHLTVLSIIEDESVPRFVRGRAMVALTLYPNADVWDFYRSKIQDSDNVVFRRPSFLYHCLKAQTRIYVHTRRIVWGGLMMITKS